MSTHIREYTLSIGGRERVLRYSLVLRRAVERALADAGLTTDPIHEAMKDNRIEVQTLILWGALRHEDERLSPDTVLAWLDAYLVEHRSMKPVWEAVRKTLMASGVLGNVVDPEGDSGKAPEPQAVVAQ